MNGLLTALLGGAAGVGQGLQAGDERAMKMQQQRMERLQLATSMIQSGITPPDELTADFRPPVQPSTPSAPNVITQQPIAQAPSVPQGVLSQVMTPRVRTGDGFSGGVPVSGPSASATNVPSPPPALGGVSGTDVIRGLPSQSMSVGGLQYDPMKSLAMRSVLFGVYGDLMKKEQEARAKASALVDAGAKNPDGSVMTPQQALSVAWNGDLAYQRSPGLGTAGYTGAKVAEQQALTPGAVAQAVQTERGTAPIRVATAINTAAGTAPIDVQKAVDVAKGTLPTEIAKAGATGSAQYPSTEELRAAAVYPQAKAAAETLKKFTAPGVATTLAQHYGSLANYFDSPEGQEFRQAMTVYANAKMDATGQQRLSPAQIKQTMGEYMPMLGDKDEVLQRKQAEIQRGLDGIRTTAGRALKFVEAPQNPWRQF